MKPLDRYLQKLRIRKAGQFIPAGVEVLDIGCSEGELFQILGERITRGVGIEPLLEAGRRWERFELVPGCFPEDLPAGCGPFDVITALAVVEHIPMDAQSGFARACAGQLKPGGRLILTVPSSRVDAILDILLRLRLIHGMSLEEHFGFEVDQVPSIYTVDGMKLETNRRFELGLNNIFVFRKGE